MRPRTLLTVNPGRLQAGAECAEYVLLWMIPDVQRLPRCAAGQRTGRVKNPGIWLGCAMAARRDLGTEESSQAHPFQTGIAIGE